MQNIEEILQNPEQILKNLNGLDLDKSLVYLAGSLLEGFGNNTSDVDVYVIYQGTKTDFVKSETSATAEVTLLMDNFIVRNIVCDSVRYDFEYWRKEDFDKLIMRLNNLDFKTENHIETLSDKEFDLLHRIKFGKPIINERIFYHTFDTINFENLDFYKVVKQSELYQEHLEDLQGAFQSNDWGTAFFMARRLVDDVVTGYLAAFGETNPSSKWMYRKLTRYQEKTGDKELLKKYIDCHTKSYDYKTINEYIKSCIKFCQDLNLKTQNMLRNKQII